MSNVAAHDTGKHGFWHMPKTFYAVLFIEFWERFAFYGLQAVAVLFFIQKFGLKEKEATDLFSSFSALLYALLVIGGYLGDKVLGLRRTYLLGIIFLMIGYGSFGIVSSVHLLYWGMGMVLVGNIFFKTNAGNYVNRCFKPTDPRFDSAFTYFYMSINLGSFFSMIIIPFVAQKTSYGFGIGLCGAGMFIALLSYFALRKNFVSADNEVGQNGGNKFFVMLGISLVGVVVSYGLGLLLRNPAMSKVLLFSVAAIVAVIFFIVRSKLRDFEKRGMVIAFILLIQSIFFWVMYMQMSTSLTLFAVHNVRNDILGITIPPEVTQSFNPFYIFLLSPILATIYVRSEHRGAPISIPAKFAYGMLVCGLAYLLLAVSCFLHDANGQISMLWLFLAYGLYSLGELLISAIGLSMVSKLMPLQLGGFAQAVWFVTTAVGQKFGGMLAGFGSVDESATTSNFDILHGYQLLFVAIGVAATVIALLIFIFVKKLASSMREVMETKAADH
jgi:POT family proton-dependent oligopeptide transporter